MSYQIKTPRGYVGRFGLTDELGDDMPQQFGYTYATEEAAETVAVLFDEAEVVETVY